MSQGFRIILGPFLFIFFYFFIGPLDGMNDASHAIFCSVLWIASWWITEAIPIPVTSLLPLVLFPTFGGLDLTSTASAYGNKIIFFYMAGFFLAIAMEKWNLHKRIALNIIYYVGLDKKSMILGFMIATAFLSMWLSNTSTSIMMLPIGIGVVSQVSLQNNLLKSNFGKVLMLGIAYSASIGGFATLYGTPPNLILTSNIEQYFNQSIDFTSWLIMALPLSCMLLIICWFYLTNFTFDLTSVNNISKNNIYNKVKELGKIKYEEKIVLIIFILFIIGLLLKSRISEIIPSIDDTIIAIFISMFLFLFSSSDKKQKIINWEDCYKLPWGIILLFGGGLSLAAAMQTSGLTLWIGDQLQYINSIELIFIVLIIVFSVNFLTEITSNLATVSMLLPILASISLSFDIHPYIIMVSATIAASCAFMLPVATPPNTVVFGSGYLKMSDMIKTGIVMNFISIIIVSIYVYYLLPILWGIDINTFPPEFNFLSLD
jgi:solute carrier family 13 (sodium-dependent dicarboxylate transporter), member 2/3/5